MSDNDKFYYDLSIQIFEDEGGKIDYSVIQNFSEDEDDHEVIVYGEADNPEEAIKRCRDGVDLVLRNE